VLAGHHRIHHQSSGEAFEGARHGPHHLVRSQRPGFDRHRRNVLQHGANLLKNQIRRCQLDALRVDGILHRQQRDDRFAINFELVKGF
jgi:hypothetical protein